MKANYSHIWVQAKWGFIF